MVEQAVKTPEQEPEAMVVIEPIVSANGTVEYAPDDTPSIATFIRLIEQPTRDALNKVFKDRAVEVAVAGETLNNHLTLVQATKAENQ
ncbi:MAG TPA: hypothetical protein VH234_00840 [Candidatus Saccharimonadales bacterium]|jgi:hypothetical protein|nr:hypothetical protein [Candidatus Saccharimonadales bacterium]